MCDMPLTGKPIGCELTSNGHCPVLTYLLLELEGQLHCAGVGGYLALRGPFIITVSLAF